MRSWIAAEKACNIALLQHKSGKGYWRRAKARRMQGRTIEAVKGSFPMLSDRFVPLIHQLSFLLGDLTVR